MEMDTRASMANVAAGWCWGKGRVSGTPQRFSLFGIEGGALTDSGSGRRASVENVNIQMVPIGPWKLGLETCQEM